MPGPIDRTLTIRFLRRAIAITPQNAATSFLRLINQALVEMSKLGELDPSIAKMSPFNDKMFRDAIDVQKGHADQGQRERADEAVKMLTFAIFECISRGYVSPTVNESLPGGVQFGAMLVTPTGREWANGTDPIPEDSSGYLAAFDAVVPNADPVIRQYVAEALVVYERDAFFAAAVMVGAASEAAIYVAADALLSALKNPKERKNLEQEIRRSEIEKILRRIFAVIERVKEPKGSMPFPVFQGADPHLHSFLESIRVQRNEAGHPKAGMVEPSAVRLALSAFPKACQKVYDLANWFLANKV